MTGHALHLRHLPEPGNFEITCDPAELEVPAACLQELQYVSHEMGMVQLAQPIAPNVQQKVMKVDDILYSQKGCKDVFMDGHSLE